MFAFCLVTWQFCSSWKQAITLTMIPFSCLNTRNLVWAAAFHTISTPLRSPQKLWPNNHNGLTATPTTGWGEDVKCLHKPINQEACKGRKVSGSHGDDLQNHTAVKVQGDPPAEHINQKTATAFCQGSWRADCASVKSSILLIVPHQSYLRERKPGFLMSFLIRKDTTILSYEMKLKCAGIRFMLCNPLDYCCLLIYCICEPLRKWG